MTTSSRYLELLAKKAELDAAIAAAEGEESAEAIETCRELIARFGLKPDDVFGKVRKPNANKGQKRGPAEPKYRHPETGATWTGRGKAPQWLGENRDEFLIRA